jgi:AcrR family transcriptional regulator
MMQNAVPTVDAGGEPAVETAVAARTLQDRADAYAEEVRRLLDATYAVMRSTGDDDPRVSDIVRESKLSNQAFYRHFRGKDELFVALLADGQRRLVETLTTRMAAVGPGAPRVRAWVEVLLAQAQHSAAAANTRPFAINGLRLADRFPAEWNASREDLLAPLRVALIEADGDADDAPLVYHLAMGAMQDALVRREVPSDADVARVVDAALAVGIQKEMRHQSPPLRHQRKTRRFGLLRHPWRLLSEGRSCSPALRPWRGWSED